MARPKKSALDEHEDSPAVLGALAAVIESAALPRPRPPQLSAEQSGRLGRALVIARDALRKERGAFAALIKRRELGISRRDGYDLVKVWTVLPPILPDRDQIEGLGTAKARALASHWLKGRPSARERDQLMAAASASTLREFQRQLRDDRAPPEDRRHRVPKGRSLTFTLSEADYARVTKRLDKFEDAGGRTVLGILARAWGARRGQREGRERARKAAGA